ncbi:hypothetical protein [Arthrobacter sp. Soil764]|uniref:hypothetical protein n=1 Tax=Arthrobacter sp. Soil764 TaxID=1736403 RepID=UPI0007004361|nr:hypothetical protein [Arthrobacter sp. Soil764]KRE92000.1 hypothetical protein ASG86_02285 [Arthrobacter sp. Soil764]
MSSNPGTRNQAGREPLDVDPTGEDPSAKDPMADEKVQLQLAIFEVTREAEGKSLDEIREMLLAAFSRHGVEPPPGTWVESVASSAYYGEPYLVDLSAAVAADAVVPAPNDEVRERLASARELQQEQLPAGIFPAPDEWNIPAGESAGGSTRTASLTSLTRWEGGAVLALAALAVAAVLAVVAVRTGAGRAGTGRRRLDT